MQDIANTVSGLVLSVVTALLMPAIVLLLVRRFAPIVGNPLWRLYSRLLGWLAVAPVRLIRVLIREATGRRR